MNMLVKKGLIGLSARAWRAVPVAFKAVFCAFALTAAALAGAAEIGRLFFTPEQRARMDYNYAREGRPDSDNRRTLSVTGIVQKQGGERTAWINGVPQQAGQSDERSPDAMQVTIPGKSKPVRIKVGEKLLIAPAAPDQ